MLLQTHENIQTAEMKLPCEDLSADLIFYTETLGFRLHQIFPADDPAVAVIVGYGLRLRLERGVAEPPGTLRLACKEPKNLAADLQSPSGTKIELVPARSSLEMPKPHYGLLVEKLHAEASWKRGRAGMLYRDLMPSRLGGSLIASHIHIPEGGTVADMVHYHTVGFQLIYCYKGWVQVVYEDQGAPFYLQAGDCVIQPPKIRHRVLVASENLEVIEVSMPAAHMTTIDHEMTLPTPCFNPNRMFDGQKFCRHEAAQEAWKPGRLAGFQSRETGICEATAGKASVQVVRSCGRKQSPCSSHTAELLFGFVLQGKATLRGEGQSSHALAAGDAFAVPPHWKMWLCQCSQDLEILEVAWPGNFKTLVHDHENLL